MRIDILPDGLDELCNLHRLTVDIEVKAVKGMEIRLPSWREFSDLLPGFEDMRLGRRHQDEIDPVVFRQSRYDLPDQFPIVVRERLDLIEDHNPAHSPVMFPVRTIFLGEQHREELHKSGDDHLGVPPFDEKLAIIGFILAFLSPVREFGEMVMGEKHLG